MGNFISLILPSLRTTHYGSIQQDEMALVYLFKFKAFQRGWSLLPTELKIQILDAYLDSILLHAECWTLLKNEAGIQTSMTNAETVGYVCRARPMLSKHNGPLMKEAEMTIDLFVRELGHNELHASLNNKVKESDAALADHEGGSWEDVVAMIVQEAAATDDPWFLAPGGQTVGESWLIGLEMQRSVHSKLVDARNREERHRWLHRLQDIVNKASKNAREEAQPRLGLGLNAGSGGFKP